MHRPNWAATNRIQMEGWIRGGLHRSQGVDDVLAHRLRVIKQHHRIVPIEQHVIDPRIAWAQ